MYERSNEAVTEQNTDLRSECQGDKGDLNSVRLQGNTSNTVASGEHMAIYVIDSIDLQAVTDSIDLQAGHCVVLL